MKWCTKNPKVYQDEQKQDLIETIQKRIEFYNKGILWLSKEEDDFMNSLPYVCSCQDGQRDFQGHDLKVCDCSGLFRLCPVCMREGLITRCPECGADWVGPLFPRVCADIIDQTRPYIKECFECDKREVCMYGIEITKYSKWKVIKREVEEFDF